VVSDINPLYMQTLARLRIDRPYLDAAYCDVTDLRRSHRSRTVRYRDLSERHRARRRRPRVVEQHSQRSEAGWSWIVLVPQGQWNFGTLDEVLGHKRRTARSPAPPGLRTVFFKVVELLEFNDSVRLPGSEREAASAGATFGLGQVLALNVLTPLLRRIDRLLPPPCASLIAVLERAPRTGRSNCRLRSRRLRQIKARGISEHLAKIRSRTGRASPSTDARANVVVHREGRLSAASTSRATAPFQSRC